MPIFKKVSVIKITVVFIIFLLFLANATGIFELGWLSKPSLNIQSSLFGFSDTAGISFYQLFQSYEFYCFLIVGLILSIALPILKPAGASLLTFICMLPPFLLSYYIPNSSPLIPMEYTLLMILILFVTNVLISYFAEVHNKQAIVNLFSQYIPPELAQEISSRPEEIDLTGEAREMTVFFSDLQDFTSTAEQLNPKQLTLLLNDYFNAMTEVLYQHGATIDKYIGDSIMAFWNAPFEQEDHAKRAMEASLAMHEAIKEISVRFKERGWPAPNMGIGINTGVMNVGNMGSKYRVAYTVVGDAVNLASRVEHLTRVYKVSTIVTESTKNKTDSIIYRELDTVQVRGKHNFTKIYEPICRKDKLNQIIEKELQKHQIAMTHYQEQNWLEARERFKALKQEYKDEYYSAMVKIIDSKRS